MLTLALDTSTARGTVAVTRDGEVLFEESFTADRSHSSSLFSILERARPIADPLDRIAVGLGPGSYAGIRISIAAAMGLAMSSGARLVGIPTPAALDVAERRYAVIGDARRGTWYWTLVQDGVCVAGPELVSEEELRTRMAAAGVPVYSSGTLPGAQLAFPSARRLALNEQGITMSGDLDPVYLREPHITYPKAGPPR